MTAPSTPLPPISRVAIIGAGGPSGISALHQLLQKGVSPSQILAYEARGSAGGIWHYDAFPGECKVAWREDGRCVLRSERESADGAENGPTAVYENLRTNLQHPVDTPFPTDVPLFPTHKQVVQYLQRVVEDRGLEPFIQFSTLVRAVYHTPNNNNPAHRWTVETSRKSGDISSRDKELFSHVIVANGHYNEPYVPPIPGLKSWTGELSHSRWWRAAKQYAGKNILVVGSRASGSDITRESAMFDESQATTLIPTPTRKIYQSVRISKAHPKGGEDLWDESLPWTKRIEVVSEIKSVGGRILYLVDGSEIKDVDVLIFATGYLYSYPFFSPNLPPFDTYPVTSSLSRQEEYLSQSGGVKSMNLNNTDTFYAPDPTLSFIGLHYLVSPFPLSEITARLIAHSYKNALIPPLKDLIRNSAEQDDVKIGFPQEYTNQDNFLEAIGEGGEDGGENDGWRRYPEELRVLRSRALIDRKKHLGY